MLWYLRVDLDWPNLLGAKAALFLFPANVESLKTMRNIQQKLISNTA